MVEKVYLGTEIDGRSLASTGDLNLGSDSRALFEANAEAGPFYCMRVSFEFFVVIFCVCLFEMLQMLRQSRKEIRNHQRNLIFGETKLVYQIFFYFPDTHIHSPCTIQRKASVTLRRKNKQHFLQKKPKGDNLPCIQEACPATFEVKRSATITMCSSFTKDIAALIRKNALVEDGEGIVVAVSAGADSTALLISLSEMACYNLIAAYIDHGLRPTEAEREISSLQELCAQRGIPFSVRSVEVKRLVQQTGRSTEDAARELRYRALEAIRTENGYDTIAVGHTLDDQVEEFFIRLIRGSGTCGLSGMSLRRKQIIRPLLHKSRAEIEDFLTDKGLAWCTDSSNLSTTLLRNRIRLDLLPELEQHYNPSLRKTILQTMDILREEERYMREKSLSAYRQCVAGDTGKGRLSIDLDSYRSCHKSIRRRIVEQCCWQLGVGPSYTNREDVDKLAAGESGKELHLSCGLQLIRQNRTLVLQRVAFSGRRRWRPAADYTLPIEGPGSYPLPELGLELRLQICSPEKIPKEAGLLTVDNEKCPFPLTVRPYRPGERFTPHRGGGRKKIARYFNEKKLDKRRRTSWPILFLGNSVVAVIGYAADSKYRVDSHSRSILTIGLTHR
ncbi:MAG: tRNA lysidine(34) synthetase TilS [Deltaproteobacteria bacterium]|nr:MAG: tRNA lysidine(34) synthetase TilS [Deltaproteobacteria bacterium]